MCQKTKWGTPQPVGANGVASTESLFTGRNDGLTAATAVVAVASTVRLLYGPAPTVINVLLSLPIFILLGIGIAKERQGLTLLSDVHRCAPLGARCPENEMNHEGE